MNLLDYQRAVTRVSFDLEPSLQDLALLGDETRWRMYRHMVRGRLQGMAELAFTRSREVVGELAFAASFSRFLAKGGPQSPLIRDVTSAFGSFAQADAQLLASAPAYARDLFAFELAKWQVAFEPARYPVLGEDGLRELDFEGIPVLNPVLKRLTLDRTTLPFCDLELAPKGDATCFDLLVYRPSHNEVRWWAIAPFFGGLIARLEQGQHSLAAAVRAVADEQGRPVDEVLLEELATDLTLAVQRGVVFGVRD